MGAPRATNSRTNQAKRNPGFGISYHRPHSHRQHQRQPRSRSDDAVEVWGKHRALAAGVELRSRRNAARARTAHLGIGTTLYLGTHSVDLKIDRSPGVEGVNRSVADTSRGDARWTPSAIRNYRVPGGPIDCVVAEGATWGAILLTANAPRRHTVSPGEGD